MIHARIKLMSILTLIAIAVALGLCCLQISTCTTKIGVRLFLLFHGTTDVSVTWHDGWVLCSETLVSNPETLCKVPNVRSIAVVCRKFDAAAVGNAPTLQSVDIGLGQYVNLIMLQHCDLQAVVGNTQEIGSAKLFEKRYPRWRIGLVATPENIEEILMLRNSQCFSLWVSKPMVDVMSESQLEQLKRKNFCSINSVMPDYFFKRYFEDGIFIGGIP